MDRGATRGRRLSRLEVGVSVGMNNNGELSDPLFTPEEE